MCITWNITALSSHLSGKTASGDWEKIPNEFQLNLYHDSVQHAYWALKSGEETEEFVSSRASAEDQSSRDSIAGPDYSKSLKKHKTKH